MTKTKTKSADVLGYGVLSVAAVSAYSVFTDVVRNGASRFAYMNQVLPFNCVRCLELAAPFARWLCLGLTIALTYFAVEAAIRPSTD